MFLCDSRGPEDGARPSRRPLRREVIPKKLGFAAFGPQFMDAGNSPYMNIESNAVRDRP